MAQNATQRPQWVTKRRICWPDPDATCLEGGCHHCNNNSMRTMHSIRAYCDRVMQVPNRGNGVMRMAHDALDYGLATNFGGQVDYRMSDGTTYEVG